MGSDREKVPFLRSIKMAGVGKKVSALLLSRGLVCRRSNV